MRILITGGTGLIGRALCPVLLQAGHQVTVLSRNPDTVAEKCGRGVTPLSRLAEWHESLAFDAVINLAGEPIVDAHWSPDRKKLLWDSRVKLTRQLVERMAACTHRPSVLLSGSAVGYYGDRGDVPLDEATSANTDFAAQLCAAWEDEAEHACLLGVRVCLLRTGLVLSSQGGLLHRMLLPFKLGLGARLGDGRQWMSWIHIDDYVAAVLKLLSSAEASGPFNMTAPQPVTNRKFTARLAATLHRPAWFVAPARLLALVLGPRKILLLGGQNVLPLKLLGLEFSFKYPLLDTALQALLPRHP
jgi:uncharacterized protein (TIGR01777 family)